MSLPKDPIEPVPEETVRIAQTAFPKGNIYMKMRDELGSIYDNAQFADLFPRRGVLINWEGIEDILKFGLKYLPIIPPLPFDHLLDSIYEKIAREQTAL